MLEKNFKTFLVQTSPKFKFYRSSIPVWLNIALAELGESEILGTQDNPRIVEYLKTVNLGTSALGNIDEIAWCSAFANWVLRQAGYLTAGLPNAKSWLNWGEVLTSPRFGCLVVLDRGTEAWQGHVGFLMDIQGSNLILFGGNQSNRVGIASYPTDKIKGYRWPKA